LARKLLAGTIATGADGFRNETTYDGTATFQGDSILRRYIPILLFSLLLITRTAAAAETVHVLVLPFDIYASQDLSYLKTDIPKFIREQLKNEGALPVDISDTQRAAIAAATSDIKALREKGLDAGADYVIWGSMTRIGNSISLDTRMVATLGNEPVFSIYNAGTGIESLRSIAKKSAEKLARRLFRKEVIAAVRVTGNKRIETDAIERVIREKPGDVLRPGAIAKDIRNIYKMGYFENIRVESENSPRGKIIIFHVKEKPTIRKITFSGNKVFNDEKLRKNLSISSGSILNIYTIMSNIDQLKIMYKEKNYQQIKIDYKIHKLKHNQADLEFIIKEGEKIKIKKITFVGNTTFSDKKLKKMIKTSEAGFFSWLTGSGDLNREDLNQDAARIDAFYHTQGFIHAKVADPVVDLEGKWIYITFKIEEGERYKVGTIDIQGDLIRPKAQLMPTLKISTAPYFDQETVRKDVLRLTDLYADSGYAYADISPLTREDKKDRLVDITYQIKKHEKVYFGNIEITGNTKTRDKVIRRELRIYEQGLYNGSRLKRSVRNLNRLDYFKNVKVETPKGSTPDKMDVKIDVKEKPTGTFTFGAGYSTVDSFFISGSVSQRNLLGRGQILKLSGQIGGNMDLYNLSFTEPWLFDIPLSTTADIYRSYRDWTNSANTDLGYDQTSMGVGLGATYPIFDYTRVGLRYRYDITDITNIADYANDNIKALAGRNTTSEITASLSYDSRDRLFNATRGQDHSLTYTYAGLGGNIGFQKVVGKLGWYIPLYKGLVTFLHGESGYVHGISGYILPDYEKFYLGGMNSIRGFDYHDINIKGVNSQGETTKNGGNSYVQFNAELHYPLFKDLGIVGVLFYDTGNVFGPGDPIDFGDLRKSAGFGIRWYSPVGPIRIEGGYILDRRANESSGINWAFSMGSAF
jgi:outer membrane protein insertion porin family